MHVSIGHFASICGVYRYDTTLESKIGYKKNKMSTDRESGRGNKKARGKTGTTLEA
jgi:hypothetical protein